MGRLFGTALILIVVGLTACAGAKAPPVQPMGSSELEILPPPPYEPLPEGVRPTLRPPETPPKVQDRMPPSYPDSALSEEIACAAKLLYHIQKDGSVTLVRLEWDEPPPSRFEESFEEEIRTAMLAWRFIPAKKLVPTTLEDGSIDLVPHPIPKAERAIVRFRVQEGRGIVE